jgi:hypothetical protein
METAVGDPSALLTIEMLPVALPVVVGAKVALNDALLPALIVIGIPAPVTPNPGPEAESCEMVTAAFPGFDNDTVCEVLPPTAMFPKLTAAGFTASCGCEATAAPVRLTTRGESGELLTIEMLPLLVPADVGANFAVKDVD